MLLTERLAEASLQALEQGISLESIGESEDCTALPDTTNNPPPDLDR